MRKVWPPAGTLLAVVIAQLVYPAGPGHAATAGGDTVVSTDIDRGRLTVTAAPDKANNIAFNLVEGTLFVTDTGDRIRPARARPARR